MVLKVITYPNKNLFLKSKPVERFDSALHAFLDDLYDTMIDYGGIGISAIQVDKPVRVMLVLIPRDTGKLDKDGEPLQEQNKEDFNEVKDEQTKNDLALIIEEVLKQRIQGVKNEKGVWVTPAFPKLLYFLDENNTKEGEYYWLTKLAAKCTTKRLVPDYISVKKMKELKNGLVYPCINKFCA